MRRRHRVSACVAVALVTLTTGCSPIRPSTSSSPPGGDSGTPSSTIAGAGGPPTPTSAPAGRSNRPPTTRTPRSGSSPTTAGPAGPHGDPDDGELGSLSHGFFRPAPYTRITVEFDVGGDAAPSAAVVNRLLAVLRDETGKAVSQVGGQRFAGKGNSCWTDDEVIGAAARSRQAHTGGSTLAVQVVFLDGHSCSDHVDSETGQRTSLLGFAFAASSMAVFGPEVAAQARLGESSDAYVKAVTVHEVGHLFGLVNISYHSRIDHEDPAHKSHSKNAKSVMFWQIEQRGLISRLTDPGSAGPTDQFDADDHADMRGLADGTY